MNPDETTRLAELLSKVPGFRGIDVKDVRRLVELLRDSPEIGSIEVKGLFGTGVVVTRTLSGGADDDARAPMSPGDACPAAPGAGPPRRRRPRSAAYSRRSSRRWWGPTTPPRNRAPSRISGSGQRVTTGQTVCIVEAMKIMNEIEAEVSGVIREVCVEDATPVEYGQVLFRVDPNG